MTDNQKILCHAYVTVVFKPFEADKYKIDMWESYDDERIRLHKELCDKLGIGRNTIETLINQAGWVYGIDPFNDPYFDICSVSDKFVELIENEIHKNRKRAILKYNIHQRKTT